MSWDNLKRYRGHAVVGQAQIERAKTGTASAMVLLEVSMGENQGQRVRYRGYLTGANGATSGDNALKTVDELRAMGCKLQRLGDWSGLGSKEVEFSVLAEVGQDGKTYYRAAFVRPLATVKPESALPASDLEALNASLGNVLAQPAGGRAPAPIPKAAEPWEQPPAEAGEIPF